MAKKRKRSRQRPRGPGPATPDGALTAQAKQDRIEAQKVSAAQASLPASAAAIAGPRDPAFWFGFEVSWAKLVTARVVIFTLLAIDAFLSIRHAPRYGAGDFNVAQLPLLDAIAPGRIAYGVGQLALAYLFTLAAIGVAARLVVPIGAAIYAWLYFGSHLDSYQHHYLVAVMLVILSFAPWQRPRGAEPATPIAAWAIRLVLVQLGIMYLWAAISKLDLAWVDGRTLASQLTGTARSIVDSTIGMKVTAVLVIVVELVLAATIWWRRGWMLAAPIGLLFHAGILLTGLEIGLFAYLMLGFYVLVVPERIWIALAEIAPVRALRRVQGRLAALPGLTVWAISIAVGLPLASLLRLEHGFAAAAIASVIPLALMLKLHRRFEVPLAMLGLAHVLAIALWIVADRASDVAIDYYRFWGGSQRRLGELATSEYAYRQYVELAPDEPAPHFQLGRVQLLQGNEAGLTALREAQRLEPARARAFIEEARWLYEHGRVTEAIETAKQATYAEPSSSEARALVERVSAPGDKPPIPAPVEHDP